jgi:hypothetical protein
MVAIRKLQSSKRDIMIEENRVYAEAREQVVECMQSYREVSDRRERIC